MGDEVIVGSTTNVSPSNIQTTVLSPPCKKCNQECFLEAEISEGNATEWSGIVEATEKFTASLNSITPPDPFPTSNMADCLDGEREKG